MAKMLRVSYQDRKPCDVVVRDLKDLHTKCAQDASYATKGRPRSQRTNGSQLFIGASHRTDTSKPESLLLLGSRALLGSRRRSPSFLRLDDGQPSHSIVEARKRSLGHDLEKDPDSALEPETANNRATDTAVSNGVDVETSSSKAISKAYKLH